MFDESPDPEDGRGAGWRLVDPRPIREKFPYTFFVPSEEEKAAIEPGEAVKLIFEDAKPEGATERMWVIYEGRDERGWYGKLDNAPVEIAGLSAGDTIRFRSWHIVAVWDMKVDDYADEEQMFARVHVDPRVLEGARIGAMERRRKAWFWPFWRRPFIETGWMIYAEDGPRPARRAMAHVAVGAVLNRDDSILPWLGAPRGSRLFRDGNLYRPK